MSTQITHENMTPSQKYALSCFINSHLYGTREVKRLEVNDWSNGKFWVTVEIGSLNDEGKLTSLICRDYFSVLVGKRGGLKLHIAPKWARGLPKVAGATPAKGCTYCS